MQAPNRALARDLNRSQSRGKALAMIQGEVLAGKTTGPVKGLPDQDPDPANRQNPGKIQGQVLAGKTTGPVKGLPDQHPDPVNRQNLEKIQDLVLTGKTTGMVKDPRDQGPAPANRQNPAMPGDEDSN